MLITEAELASLEAANTSDEWNAACLAIKNARGGAFPEDWYPRVMQGGCPQAFW